MIIVEASYKIEQAPEPKWLMEHLERCARTCYRSEGRIAPGTADKLIRKVLDRGHESVIEHASITVRFVCDRGVSHELVRHRLASYSQESTRYVRYDGEKDGREVAFVQPCFWEQCSKQFELWVVAMQDAERAYVFLLKGGAKPEEARSVLPNSLRTEIVVTANIREWRHILRLRTSPAAHPQMREIMVPLGQELAGLYPVLFGEFGDGDDLQRSSHGGGGIDEARILPNMG